MFPPSDTVFMTTVPKLEDPAPSAELDYLHLMVVRRLYFEMCAPFLVRLMRNHVKLCHF